MIVAGLRLLAATVLAQSPASDSLLEVARTSSPSALVLAVRQRPLETREAVAIAMARTVQSESNRNTALAAARALGRAYALAWRDSFLVREVERFASRPPRARAGRVRADSLRRAGVAVWAREGPAAAIGVWRRSLAAASSIRDTTAMASTLDNIGAGFVALGVHDSAATYLARARHLAIAVGDVRVEGNVTGHLGDLSADRGDLAAARTRYDQARVLRERVGDTRGAAADLNNIGLLLQRMGDLQDARRHLEAALALNRREGRDASLATNLVNLAGLATLEGDFTGAATQYRNAVAIWTSREEWAETAEALQGLGQLELRRGDYLAAQKVLREAFDLFDRTGRPEDALEAQRALADALAASGDLQGALGHLHRAETLADSVDAGTDVRAGIALARADLAVRLNALAQAEVLYERAGELFRQAGDDDGQAAARHGLAFLLLERDDPERAEALLSQALRAQLASGDQRAAALTRLAIGEAAWERADTARARQTLGEVARELRLLNDPVATATALGARAALETAVGESVGAESLYREAIQVLGQRAAPDVRWHLRAGVALARRRQGDLESAARELRVALHDIETQSQSLWLPERRSAFLADKWDVYAQLVLAERARGLTTAAFEVSERMRAREMLESLALGRVSIEPDESSGLVAREQDLRRRIAELMREVEFEAADRDERGPDLSASASTTRRALLRAQDEYADLLLRLRERAPRHVALVVPSVATWRSVANRLDAGQALVTYLMTDSGSVAFAITRDTMRMVGLPAHRREVARLVEFARGTLELRRSDPGWRAPWQRLHAWLIAPLDDAGVLSGISRLVIVPHAELHYLPFAALVDAAAADRFLGDRYELTVTPSASVWLELGTRATGSGTGALAFAPRPEALPGSQREVESVRAALRESVLARSGDAASEAAFRRAAPSRRVLHLATYGILNKHNPLFSFVELAPGGGHDGRLEVHEVLGLSLVADLVVLSACQTALGSGSLADVPSGDDWVGLTRAFLHAGAAQVVASLWPVDDWATALLMERFYASLAQGATAARALADAQQAMRADPTTANPFYWAGFVLVAGAVAERR